MKTISFNAAFKLNVSSYSYHVQHQWNENEKRRSDTCFNLRIEQHSNLHYG